jgi:hypothetical protein
MRKGVRFRSDIEPIERRTIAPAPSDVSCERTFFTRVLDMAAIVLVEDKSVSAGGGDNGER